MPDLVHFLFLQTKSGRKFSNPSTFFSYKAKVDNIALFSVHILSPQNKCGPNHLFPSTFLSHKAKVEQIPAFPSTFSSHRTNVGRLADFRPHSISTEQMWTSPRKNKSGGAGPPIACPRRICHLLGISAILSPFLRIFKKVRTIFNGCGQRSGAILKWSIFTSLKR